MTSVARIAALLSLAFTATACFEPVGPGHIAGYGDDAGTRDAQPPDATEPEPLTCSACWWPGGLDHLEIECRVQGGGCVLMLLSNPAIGAFEDVTASGDWGVFTLQNFPGCGASDLRGGNVATEATGSIDVEGLPPTRLKLDVVARFASDAGTSGFRLRGQEVAIASGCTH